MNWEIFLVFWTVIGAILLGAGFVWGATFWFGWLFNNKVFPEWLTAILIMVSILLPASLFLAWVG